MIDIEQKQKEYEKLTSNEKTHLINVFNRQIKIMKERISDKQTLILILAKKN